MSDQGEGEVDHCEPDAPLCKVFQIQETAATYLNVSTLDTNTPIDNCDAGTERKEAVDMTG